MRAQRHAGRVGQAPRQQVALQRGGDRPLALQRRLGGRARGALGLQPPALAQVVELHERRQDLAPGLAHPEGQHRDGDVLEGAQAQLGARQHRGAVEAGDQQAPELVAVLRVHEVEDRGAGADPSPGQPLQRGIDAQQAPVGVDQRRARRQRGPGQQQQLVGARPRDALPLELAEDLDLRAQHGRLERLEHVVDGARVVARGDLVDLGADGGQEDDRRRTAALAAADEAGGLEAVHARHLHVEEHDGVVVVEQRAQRLLARQRRAQLHVRAARGPPRAPAGSPAGRRRAGRSGVVV